jgi:hypothetical protein
LISCSTVVLTNFMEAIPATKRAQHTVGTASVCDACGKHFDTSNGFDKHQTS